MTSRSPIEAPRIQDPWHGCLSHPLPREHAVHLYRDQRGLIDALALFAGTGLFEGDAVILVATSPHVVAVTQRLEGAGFDMNEVRRWGQLSVIDAPTLLSRFMVDGLPDGAAFGAVVGETLGRAQAGGRHRRVRVYGEMVDLLWKQNLRAAIRLEELWNAVIEAHPISLLCSYCLDGESRSSFSFPGALHRAHSRLIPVEAWA